MGEGSEYQAGDLEEDLQALWEAGVVKVRWCPERDDFVVELTEKGREGLRKDLPSLIQAAQEALDSLGG